MTACKTDLDRYPAAEGAHGGRGIALSLVRDQAAERERRPCPAIHSDTLILLLQHDWPGNVRELQNPAFRYALGLDLGIGAIDREVGKAPLSTRLAQLEKQLIHNELQRYDGDLKATYRSLGISRKTLYDKMHRYGSGRPPSDE
jgi:DNA-binding NtrC family response regulator